MNRTIFIIYLIDFILCLFVLLAMLLNRLVDLIQKSKRMSRKPLNKVFQMLNAIEELSDKAEIKTMAEEIKELLDE